MQNPNFTKDTITIVIIIFSNLLAFLALSYILWLVNGGNLKIYLLGGLFISIFSLVFFLKIYIKKTLLKLKDLEKVDDWK